MSVKNEVRIAGGKLILSLPEAEAPVVWQMDLSGAQASSFTVSEDKKKKVFSLVSKTQNGEEDVVAVFKEKDQAVDILMQTSGALQGASVDVAGSGDAAVVTAAQPTEDKSDKYGALIALALIVVLFVVWMMSATSELGGEGIGQVAQGSADVAPRETSGVPVSADDFLSSQ